MTDVTPRFKAERPEKRQRGWNSTLPAPTGYLPRRTELSKRRTKRAAEDDRTFKTGWDPSVERCVWETDGRPCGQPAVAHHVQGRAVRPDRRGDASNRAPLCPAHNVEAEDSPPEARRQGLKGGETYEAANRDPMAKIRRQAGT